MSRLLFFHDFSSPFCRLAVGPVAAAADRAGLDLRPVPFELYPAPAHLPAPEELDREEMETAQKLARERGLELGRPRHVPRTRKAHEAVAYAREQGAGRAVLHGLYDALWGRGLDISRLDLLADLCQDAGLDREAAHVALGLDTHEDEVVREQEAAAAAGLTGVPAVQLRDVVAVGLLTAEELADWIDANG
jgi:predicted DsbA family dithiol-disulfide isomerase